MVKQNTNEKVTIYIDNVAHQVNPKDNLLAGVLSEKLNLPYFCWHPSMGSVGACRQCAVTQFQDENDTRGRMVMSCMTPVVEGMRIGLNDHSSSKFREQVIAAMMTNHPHDCPVCAEGGECHLQDMTVMTGHTSRQYCGSKRTYENQNLGEFVGHEMNRCITCYRCVRFYKDYAGGDDFDVFGSSNHVYFGRQSDGQLESEFSGNLVEICPTGVFTNKLFSAHYSRKWDLQSAPSVCSHCAVGCNTSIGERYGSVRRVVNRYNYDINGYFLCDRGRFGIGFVNSEQRITQALGFATSNIESSDDALLTNLDVAKSLVHFKNEKFIGIGSDRASLEANYYLKYLVGDDKFSAGYSNNQMMMATQHLSCLSAYQAPSLQQVEQCDFVFIIGEDISQTSPRIALAVRQALRNASISAAADLGVPSWQDAAVRTIGGQLLSPLFMLNSLSTKLDKVAQQYLIMPPKGILEQLESLTTQLTAFIEDTQANNLQDTDGFNHQLLTALLAAKQPLIISGYSLQSAEILAAIKSLMMILHSESFKNKQQDINCSQLNVTALAIMPNACNSLGLLSLVDEKTLSFEQVLKSLIAEEMQSLILLEQEFTEFSDKQLELLRAHAKTIIVLDHSQSRVSQFADFVMPVAPVSEGNGHYVNYQGFAQQYHQVHPPILPIQESWRWCDSLANTLFSQNKANKLAHHSLAQLHQFFEKNIDNWPIEKNKVAAGKGVARQTHRASGRTSQMANINVHESKTTKSFDDQFNFSMEGAPTNQPKNLNTADVNNNIEMPFVWAPGWNSNQAINQYQSEVAGELIHQVFYSKLAFSEPVLMLEKWPVLSKQKTTDIDDLVFIQQVPWYQADWQSTFVPEFTLLDQGNSLVISTEDAQQQGFKDRQFCSLHFKVNDEVKKVIAKLCVDDELASGLAFGKISQLSPLQSNIALSLTQPTEQEVAAYLTSLRQDQENAKQDKINTLTRLKENDQHIPIRLVSGGLDDV